VELSRELPNADEAAAPAEVRARLVEMRREVIAKMGPKIDAGWMSLLATVQQAIVAIDAAEAEEEEARPN
jgi:hypothetical protein